MKINVDNRDRIDAALDRVNGKAGKHTAKAYEVRYFAQYAEKTLDDLRIPKAHRKGAIASAMSGDDLPSAYKYQPVRTEFTIVRGASGWFLTAARREDYGGLRVRTPSITLSQAAINAGAQSPKHRMSVLIDG